MTPSVQHVDETRERYTDERCWILELSNDDTDPDVSIARARVACDVTTRWHRLVSTIERYVILEGEGRVEIGDRPARTMHVGDVARIPAGMRQRIANTGPSDLVFLAICTPRYRDDRYEDVDDAPPDRPAT